MSRRRGKSTVPEQEHAFTRSIDILCPIDGRHRLGSVAQDSYRTRVDPRKPQAEWSPDDRDPGELRYEGEAESVGVRDAMPATVTGAQVTAGGGRLRASCRRCPGSDYLVAWPLVLAVFDDMAEHGPRSRTLPLDASAWRAVVSARAL